MAKRKTTNRKKSKTDFKIGFVGVGRMGANMARNLVENGFTISAVSDANTRSARALAKELGCAAPKKLSEVTALSDVVITVVTDDASMRSIFSASGDSLLTEAKGTTFLNCATISPATHVLVEKRAEKVGASSLEGCMASSITQARQGTLYLMCGGKRSVFNKVRPILDALSVSLRYIGTAGQAAQVKALVNMVMNINTAGLAEGLGLGKSLGLDLKTLMSVFSQTGANSRVLETDGEDMVIRDHECYFSADHAAKDSGIALKLANEQGLNLPLATATKAQFEKMKKLGIGDLDKSGIAELTFPGRKGDKGGKGGKGDKKK
ncbi:MAG: NAD(P)-dependent oxidoreductase [Gemmatimonadetes bacterium]|jgi:3-hydroxyisobutyrate dehydrogenase-like beta-hydroxyacid dehydrogenase|nr:NAD(P)-dependent oxidoreductase [Gemmatimonadota bacterium]MBT5324987.1 NAD(P)-dependent oxidoreductase [Gemmatimonadota bacterium]MBT5448275.1 NAD(P)-dependent oxidoreductase [Gemmatimonadota bacterium]MBT5804096.1 NAD(P)-dependent oxidoreductase [Gemmatimonadota bacterium]MBT6620819.1 NAD(P)-dependent oxidoreductase [Gemmatimonadota bacterium]|tara:strand:+ start:372 stop:1334 length:963 start_codon:yes stop_codon:yes gene_type:complete